MLKTAPSSTVQQTSYNRLPLSKKPVSNAISQQIGAWNERIFRNIHSNNLIYNTCWEDPRCDRALLELDASSRVVMIPRRVATPSIMHSTDPPKSTAWT